MTSFTSGFNASNLKTLRDKINAALTDIDPSLEISAGNITYQDGECTVKVQANVIGMETAADVEFQMACERHNLDPNFQAIVSNLGMCQLIGYKSRAPKWPWIIMTPGGERRKIGHEMATRLYRKA